MGSCCVVRQKYLVIKQLKIVHVFKGIRYPSWVVAPHFSLCGCSPCGRARKVSEELSAGAWGSGSGPSAVVALQGSLAIKTCACSELELDGGGGIFMENSDLLYESKVQTEQFSGELTFSAGLFLEKPH